jgi:hypothetical protein
MNLVKTLERATGTFFEQLSLGYQTAQFLWLFKICFFYVFNLNFRPRYSLELFRHRSLDVMLVRWIRIRTIYKYNNILYFVHCTC